jgi:hypothetical protein
MYLRKTRISRAAIACRIQATIRMTTMRRTRVVAMRASSSRLAR